MPSKKELTQSRDYWKEQAGEYKEANGDLYASNQSLSQSLSEANQNNDLLTTRLRQLEDALWCIENLTGRARAGVLQINSLNEARDSVFIEFNKKHGADPKRLGNAHGIVNVSTGRI